MNNKKILIGGIIIVIILIGALFLFNQNFNRKSSNRGCPWVMKLNFDYNENPYATVNNQRTKLIVIPHPYTYPEFLDSIPKNLNKGYLLNGGGACNAEEAKIEWANPNNLVFFDMTFEEYSSTYDYGANFQETYPKIIFDSIQELYICDLEFEENPVEEFNKIIQQEELNTKCEKII